MRESNRRQLGRAERRRAVVALYAGLVLLVAAAWVAGPAVASWPVIVVTAGPLAALTLAALIRVHRAGRAIAGHTGGDHASGTPDERQLGVRDRAHRRAYQVLGTLFALFALGTWAGARFELPPPPAPVLLASACVVLILWGTLPSAVMAWAEPDPILDTPPGVRPLRRERPVGRAARSAPVHDRE